MKIVMLGVNHRTAPLLLRERLALVGQNLDRVYDLLGRHRQVEVVALSTCNRSELYLADPEDGEGWDAQLSSVFAQCCSVGADELAGSLLLYSGDDAVRHLFHVAGGIDSMVLGEPQILGQVKRAYEEATRRGTVGPAFNTIFQEAIAAAKQVRHATAIGQGRVSIGSVAVDFARQIFHRFDDKTVVVVGAGELVKLILRHMAALSPAKTWVTNRSLDHARQLAGSFGTEDARPFDQLDDLLVEADIVLTGTGAAQPIMTADRFMPLLRRRKHRPLFLIDVALPRDIEPAVGELSDIYLYNLDDLQQVVAQTYEERSDEVEQCRSMLDHAAGECINEVQHRDIGQIIKMLRQKLHQIGRLEQQRTVNKIRIAPPDDMARLIEEHTQRLINKVLHLPLKALDRRHPDESLSEYAQALHKLFELDKELDRELDSFIKPVSKSITAQVAQLPSKPQSPS